MNGIGMRWLALCAWAACLATLTGACSESHGPNAGSSGSNWLMCVDLADCSAPEAVACSSGFCVNRAGERIERRGSGGSGARSGKPSAGTGTPDSATTVTDADVRVPTPTTDSGSGGMLAPAPSAESCPWGVSALLAQVGSPAPDRLSCGFYIERNPIPGAITCFVDAIDAGSAVELTVDRCRKCDLLTTYVATEGKRFEITRESDLAPGADGLAEAVVRQCTTLGFDLTSAVVSCVKPVELLRCSQPLAAERVLEPRIPVVPFKVADASLAGFGPTVVLHVGVRNRSRDRARMSIEVNINQVHAITGEFERNAEPQWFDIEVPAGDTSLAAWTYDMEIFNNTGTNGQNVPTAAESWVMVEYGVMPPPVDDPEAAAIWPDHEQFFATVHEAPVDSGTD
jgi:hypothetical protein